MGSVLTYNPVHTLPHTSTLYGEHAYPQPPSMPLPHTGPLYEEYAYNYPTHGSAKRNPPLLGASLSTTPSMALPHASMLTQNLMPSMALPQATPPPSSTCSMRKHAYPQPHPWPCHTPALSMGSMLIHNPIYGPATRQPPLWGACLSTTP